MIYIVVNQNLETQNGQSRQHQNCEWQCPRKDENYIVENSSLETINAFYYTSHTLWGVSSVIDATLLHTST
jgi:hypothetical protein